MLVNVWSTIIWYVRETGFRSIRAEALPLLIARFFLSFQEFGVSLAITTPSKITNCNFYVSVKIQRVNKSTLEVLVGVFMKFRVSGVQ